MTRIFIFSFSLVLFISCGKIKHYDLNCGDTINGKKIEEKEFTIACPQNCVSGFLWGTNSYTADSSLCKGAIHSGIISLAGGIGRVKVVSGQNIYEGSEKNGVKSNSWGKSDMGFVIIDAE